MTQLLKDGKKTFEKIHGYENSVIPQLERAILAGHNINFLGLRGQAKTRLARQMVNLLDEWIPVIKESEINDDPTSPISTKGKEIIKNHGDKTEIDWIHRSERFYEKLATPCKWIRINIPITNICLLYTSPSPRDIVGSRMPSSA